MTDANLTPEVYGDFGLPLAQLRPAPTALRIEVGDTILTRGNGSFAVIHSDGAHVWAHSTDTHPGLTPPAAYVWSVTGRSRSLSREYDAIAVTKRIAQ